MVLLSKVIPRSAVLIGLDTKNKKDAIKELVKVAKKAFKIKIPADKIVKSIIEREKQGPTAIGSGVAIPHTKIKGLNATIGAFAKMKKELSDFVGVDGAPVEMFFLVASDEKRGDEYQEVLKTIVRVVNDKQRSFSFLQQANSVDAVIDVFEEVDGIQQKA